MEIDIADWEKYASENYSDMAEQNLMLYTKYLLHKLHSELEEDLDGMDTPYVYLEDYKTYLKEKFNEFENRIFISVKNNYK